MRHTYHYLILDAVGGDGVPVAAIGGAVGGIVAVLVIIIAVIVLVVCVRKQRGNEDIYSEMLSGIFNKTVLIELSLYNYMSVCHCDSHSRTEDERKCSI